MRVVLATRNPGKAREFGRLLGAAFRVEPLPPEIESPEETGSTFLENARLKAVHAFRALGGITAVIADDSGIEVAALGGAPGVRSARYAGVGADDRANVDLLLERLAPFPDRSARFVCSLVLALPADGDGPELMESEGVLTGEVAGAPRGNEGFGYDPVFQPTGWSITLGEATVERKDAVSHRSRAVRSLLESIARHGAAGAAAPADRPPEEEEDARG